MMILSVKIMWLIQMRLNSAITESLPFQTKHLASQGQPAAAQTFFETNPYYAAAAAAHVQYTAPTSPDYTTSATSAAQLAAGIGSQSSSVTAAFLAQQQQLQNSGFMQVM